SEVAEVAQVAANPKCAGKEQGAGISPTGEHGLDSSGVTDDLDERWLEDFAPHQTNAPVRRLEYVTGLTVGQLYDDRTSLERPGLFKAANELLESRGEIHTPSGRLSRSPCSHDYLRFDSRRFHLNKRLGVRNSRT